MGSNGTGATQTADSYQYLSVPQKKLLGFLREQSATGAESSIQLTSLSRHLGVDLDWLRETLLDPDFKGEYFVTLVLRMYYGDTYVLSQPKPKQRV